MPPRMLVHRAVRCSHDFEAIADKRGNRPEVTGEMIVRCSRIYSSRIEVKQRTRMMEYLLTAAEKVSILGEGTRI
jgi:hypothetical protein